jgi:hypothetical protein
MARYYAFNGDADGLCALQQLRLAEPGSSTLITGVKRDIALLERVPASASDECTVLDVSLDVNRAALLALLNAGVSVRYFDHHFAGEVPEHALLEAHLDPSPTVCTSLLVDRALAGRHRPWAIVGAFGDSLAAEANALARELGMSEDAAKSLEELGVCMNYNAYGETVADLHVPPVELAARMLDYPDPLEFAQSSDAFAVVRAGYRDDMAQARRLEPARQAPGALMFLLPDQAWARRASGTFANELLKSNAGAAIAIVSPKSNGGYLVSIRVPKDSKVAADAFCRSFPTGGGRRTAAGINDLPPADLERFAAAFAEQFSRSQA